VVAHCYPCLEASWSTWLACSLLCDPARLEGELRCVLAVIRHGDRTPKQKMKMKVTQEPLLALLHKYLDAKGKQAKLKVRWRVFGLHAYGNNAVKGQAYVCPALSRWH
jgi:hypothetical protein